MFSKIIKHFFISEKVFNKDYAAKTHKIDIPYILKIGDKVHGIKYQGRGTGEFDARILDINKKGICIYTHLEKIVFLNWKDEDRRELEFYPFYQFNPGINDKNFKNCSRSLNDFCTTYQDLDSKWNVIIKNKNKFEIEKAKSYVRNFKNVQLEEFQESAKQINMFRFV